MPLKVLYLDDEGDLCEIFSDQFTSLEISIVTFTDAKKALEAAKRNPPDVIFLDYRIPGTSGDKVAQAMAPEIPKYLISGEISPVTEYRFEKIFGKPLPMNEIQAALNLHASKKKIP